MKKFIYLLSAAFLLIFCQIFSVYGNTYGNSSDPSTVFSTNEVTSINNQNMQGQGYGYGEGGKSSANAEGGNAEGGNASSDSDSIAVSGDSGAVANISTNSTSNYEGRTSPISTLPPYLPTFSHGGWGTIQGYFPNGPTNNNRIYERAFYPGSELDMDEIKGVMKSLSYKGPLSLVGGLLNGVGALLGRPDNFHHGRGFEISSSVIRKRRPNNRPLIILIDNQINKDYLSTTGYAYVGKISLEGETDRNWDQVYKAAIAEALPWDIDIILISGGMKGVTIGSTLSFPSAGGAYAQTNYSVSLLGGKTSGITEGKGEAILSAECYRYSPQAIRNRAIPKTFYDRIHTTQVSTPQNVERISEYENARLPASAPAPAIQQKHKGVNVSQKLYEMAGFDSQQQTNYMTLR